MNNQLEQTIAKIEALPDGADLYAGDWDNPPVADLQFTMSDLKVLAAEVKRLTEYVQELADHGFENARKILEGESRERNYE